MSKSTIYGIVMALILLLPELFVIIPGCTVLAENTFQGAVLDEKVDRLSDSQVEKERSDDFIAVLDDTVSQIHGSSSSAVGNPKEFDHSIL